MPFYWLLVALQSDTSTPTPTESQYHTLDITALSVHKPSSPSSLHILFPNLVDLVKELLQLGDASLLVKTCKSLIASEKYRIRLFSDSYINNVCVYTNGASLLMYLSFLFTWSDHSILKAFVSSSNDEAVQLIDEFWLFIWFL